MLRESQVTTKYIEVFDYIQQNPDQYDNEVEVINEEAISTNNRSRSESNRHRSRSPFNSDDGNSDLQGSIEGPINPINYAGTQINIWGFPPVDLGTLIDPNSTNSHLGFMTEQMINVCN